MKEDMEELNDNSEEEDESVGKVVLSKSLLSNKENGNKSMNTSKKNIKV